MPGILFVCTANLCRSPLAAACFRQKLQLTGQSRGWSVESAGTRTVAGRAVPKDLMVAAANLGIDLTAHLSRCVDSAMLSRHDLILVMEKAHRKALIAEAPGIQPKIHLLSEVVHGMSYDIPDPFECARDMNLFAAEFARFMERGYRKIWEVSAAHQILSAQ